MRLALTEAQSALQHELRSYFARLVTEIEGMKSEEPSYTRYIRRMGEDGWLGIGWPREYGGLGRGPVDQMIFVEESHWAGVPLPLLTLNSIGPTLMRLGTEEQRSRWLPGILRGQLHFAVGYTEPSAGTDLASLQTGARRDGDEFVIRGEKLYTSAIQYAGYVWLAARTDQNAPKHKGLSVFVVPTDAPGFHWTPLRTTAGEFTSSTYYEDVRVPATNLIGRENQGWSIITNQLNHERVAICPV
ncbi:MAG: acyl-CoA dehydrogenase family protein, partial [Acidimicrobiales bacterium]